MEMERRVGIMERPPILVNSLRARSMVEVNLCGKMVVTMREISKTDNLKDMENIISQTWINSMRVNLE